MKFIPPDAEASFSLTVTDTMTVDFEELGKVHPVYATYWLVKHLELVSRKLILPYLEPHEDAIGFEVSARHLASALPGMELRFFATLRRQEGRRVCASCRAESELGDLIGTGETTQVVLPKARLQASIDTLRARWARHPRA